jgi:hypothetical protein
MFRRIEVYNEDMRSWHGCDAMWVNWECSEAGALAPGEIMQAAGLRLPGHGMTHKVFFWFTEAGWRKVGKKIIRSLRTADVPFRVKKVKENEVSVSYRDKLQVAGQRKYRRKRRR